MSQPEAMTRRERRARERDDLHAIEHRRARRSGSGGGERLRAIGFAAVVVAVLAIGGALAFGDFLDRPSGTTSEPGTVDVQSSMAGFTPSEIRVTAGETARINWWTDDAAAHLEGGVHTMVSDELGLYEELPAEGNRTVVWAVPDKPGVYDVWCDSCCGGKDSPSMHGTIIIEPKAATLPRVTA